MGIPNNRYVEDEKMWAVEDEKAHLFTLPRSVYMLL